MDIHAKRGKKSDKDLAIFFKTDGWEPVHYVEILRLLKLLFENEDRNYPPPRYKGRQMLMDAITDVFQGAEPEQLAVDYEFKVDMKQNWRVKRVKNG